jgi:hypothetical protein
MAITVETPISLIDSGEGAVRCGGCLQHWRGEGLVWVRIRGIRVAYPKKCGLPGRKMWAVRSMGSGRIDR